MGLVLDTVTVEGNVDIGGNITKGGATISLPTSTDTIVLLTESQTLTNKTLSGASNTFSNIATSSLTGTLQSTQFPALTGDVTTTAGSLATTIAANAVSNTKLAQVSTQTFKGRTTAGSGNVEDLSGTQATAMLDVFGADSGAGGVKGLVPATIAGDAARFLRGDGTWQPNGSGTVTSVSVTTANGVSGSVATSTSTPAITLTLGAITPSSVAAVGTVTGSNLSGSNTGDQTITLTGDVTGSGTGSFATTIAANAVTLAKFQQVATGTILGRSTAATGNIEVLTVLPTAVVPAFTGDVTNTAGSLVTTIGALKVTNAMLAGSIAFSKLVGTDITAVGTLVDLTVTNPITGTITGNAGTATALQTARAINGVSFDGTAPITITAAAGTLTGTTLNATVVTSSLTSVGTLANLTVTNPISGSITGSSASTTGNAATATALATPRAINGVSFDGTAPITITAAAGTLTGTTLNATVVTSSLTSVGTLANLTVTNPISGSITGNAATVTTNANLTGPITSSGNATSVTTNAITNTMLAQVATQTFKGRTTAATGNVEDLTATQATALLNVFGGDAGAGGVKGLVPATVSGDAAKYLKGDGTWGTIAGGGTVTSVSVTTANGVSGSVATATTTPAISITLGAITPTTVNGLTITTTTGTLTIASGKTLTASNSLTFTGTDASSVAFGTGGTVGYLTNKISDFAAVTSAELLAKVSDETGSGALVFATSPVLVTPTLGVATATRVNNQSFTGNFSTAAQAITAVTRTYLTGSQIAIPANGLQVGTFIRWVFDITKTAAGTAAAASFIDIAFGTAGTTADTARVTLAKPAGTAVVDNARVIVEMICRGPIGASGVAVGHLNLTHNLSTTGIANIPAVNVTTISAAFNVTTPTFVGLCMTTGTNDAYTLQMMRAETWNL